MTRFVKHAVAVLMAAAFAIALAVPGQAQQDNMYRYGAASQHAYMAYDAARDRDMAAERYGAYDYVAGPAGWSNAVDCTQSPASPNYVPCPNN